MLQLLAGTGAGESEGSVCFKRHRPEQTLLYPGAVTLIQRFGSALNLNIHFHMLFLDGVYVGEAGSSARFRRVKAPTTAELTQLTHAIAHRHKPACSANSEKIPGVLGMQSGLNSVSMPLGAME